MGRHKLPGFTGNNIFFYLLIVSNARESNNLRAQAFCFPAFYPSAGYKTHKLGPRYFETSRTVQYTRRSTTTVLDICASTASSHAQH